VSENQGRRGAHRQQRGLRRVDEILAEAGALFAEIGYDRTTTNMIAARAGISTGSLYQYFPNKEAIAQAYATAATTRLHQVYDAVLVPEIISLPLWDFLDTYIESLIAAGREFPGYLSLTIASTISPPIALALSTLNGGIVDRVDELLRARWPEVDPDTRRVRGILSRRLFLTVLPLVLEEHAPDARLIVHELKTMLYLSWANAENE
jgi:AcrR family transcriptional regulator